MVKKIIMLVICTLFLGLVSTDTVVYADEKREQKFEGLFVFKNEEEICDLSGIKVDIYRSVIDDVDEEIGLTAYAHEYYSSVYTDVNGAFSFVKPSEQFVVLVDVSTLPEQIGINKVMSFYKNSETNDVIEMCEVKEIQVSYNEVYKDGLKINLYDENSKEVFADYRIDSSDDKLTYQSIILDTYNFTGNVVCGDIDKEFSFSLPYDVCATVSSAVETSQISREKAVDLLTSKLEYMTLNTSLDDIIKDENCEQIIKTIKTYLNEENANSKSVAAAENKLVKSSGSTPPQYTNKATYPANYAASGIVVYYENSNEYASVPQYVLDTYGVALAAKNTYCGQMGFRAPSLVEIYLVQGGTTQTTYIDNDGNAFIEIHCVDMTDDMSTSKRASVTHEFFHCIEHEYKHLDYTPKWYTEAFAEWGTYMVRGKTALDVEKVNDFLEYTYQSVDYLGPTHGIYQEYGRVLLPAFLTQYFGGYTKVRGVLEYLSTHSPQSSSPILLYDAITSVVQSSGYDFYSFFVEWAAANYTPKTKYSIALAGWNDTPFISNVYQPGSYTSHSGRCGLNYLAAHYQEFVLPTSGSYTIDFTLSPYSTSTSLSGLSGKLLLKDKETGDSISYNMNLNNASFYTFSLNSNANNYSRACIMPVNTNTSGTLEYWYGATLQ